MKILHLAPHLGGGVGKAHAAMAPHMPRDIVQTFALLYAPIDRRHVDAIRMAGGHIVAPADRCEIERLAQKADIIQFEFWGHPDLDALIASWVPPGIQARTVTWCHTSGVADQPLFADHPWRIPSWSLDVDRFVATSSITLPAIVPWHNDVIGSGFGFDVSGRELAELAWKHKRHPPGVIYLGTVDFKKMHPEFFSALDSGPSVGQVSVWGHVSENAIWAHQKMNNPWRVKLWGHTLHPKDALSGGDIFFYPLHRGHYGTAENALIEAMSMGLVPVVLDNPAEMAIVENGQTGIVASNIDAAVEAVVFLSGHPGLREDMSRRAVRAARKYRPERSAAQFVTLWSELMDARGVQHAACG